MRVMTGVLRRIGDTRWEAVYKMNGELYQAQTLASRELAEQHLARHKDTLNAAGWTEDKRTN
jgi:hypothetical protein